VQSTIRVKSQDDLHRMIRAIQEMIRALIVMIRASKLLCCVSRNIGDHLRIFMDVSHTCANRTLHESSVNPSNPELLC